MTLHLWPQEWGWYDPTNPTGLNQTLVQVRDYLDQNLQIASDHQKPGVIEAFSIGRDVGSFRRWARTDQRDRFFEFIFDLVEKDDRVSGSNFWGYGGLGNPFGFGKLWNTGEDFIGDTPNVPQGMYNVYFNDITMARVKDHSDILKAIMKKKASLRSNSENSP